MLVRFLFLTSLIILFINHACSLETEISLFSSIIEVQPIEDQYIYLNDTFKIFLNNYYSGYNLSYSINEELKNSTNITANAVLLGF